MTTIFPPGSGGSSGGGSTGGEGDVLGMIGGARRKGQRTTSTQQDVQTANVPNSGGTGAVNTNTESTDRRKKRRSTVLTGSTGVSEEPNTYTPSIGP